MPSSSITVTIAQWGKVDFTERCVDSLLRCGYEGELEIIVYDNDSPGGIESVELGDSVTLIRGDSNIGFGPAHNHMAEVGKGELLLILNNDTILTPSALSTMVEAMQREGVGAVSPRYLGFDGRNLEMGGYVGKDGWAAQLLRGATPPQYLTRASFIADYGSAACLLTRRDLFLEMGGFDDRFAPAYYEDTDYCFRLQERGLCVIVEPRATVYHFEGATAGKDTSTGMKQLQLKHREVFAERWSERLRELPPISQEMAIASALELIGHCVLWISPELPRPDREAGHARMVAMMQTLRDSGSRVVCWSEMAPEWERYGSRLEEAGIPWFAFRTTGRNAHEDTRAMSSVQELLALHPWDLVVVSFPEMAARFVPEIRRLLPDVPIVVDAVDLHFLRASRHPDADETLVEEIRKGELEVYRSVDGVITAGEYELDIMVELVPEVPAGTYTSVATIETVPEPLSSAGGKQVFLGNFNHGPNVAAVDHWVAHIYPRLSDSTRAPLALYGSYVERFADRWPPEAVEVRGWVPDLRDAFRASRVFVVPLTYGAGTKGKILEAAAAGVPILTTSVGAEGYSGSLREALFIVDDPDEFAAAVNDLANDDTVWEEARERTFKGAIDWEQTAEIERSEWVSWLKRRRRSARHRHSSLG